MQEQMSATTLSFLLFFIVQDNENFILPLLLVLRPMTVIVSYVLLLLLLPRLVSIVSATSLDAILTSPMLLTLPPPMASHKLDF